LRKNLNVPVIIFIVGLLTSDVLAQDEARQQALDEARQQVRVWQVRVDDLTTEIVSESSSVSEAEQSMYLALLAKKWWKVDEARARIHLKRSVQKMIAAITAEDKKDLQRELKFCQTTLAIVFALDEKLGIDLVGQIEKAVDSSDDDNKKENPEMAELFAAIGLQAVKTNPKVALACGMDSLIYGFATALPPLVVELNLKDPILAETLLRRALILSRESSTSTSNLLVFNFNRYMTEFNQGKGFSDVLQRLVSEVFADKMAAAAAVEQERVRRCGIAYYAPAFLPRIDEYLPGRSLTFRQDLAACIPFSGSTTREQTRAASSYDEPKAVEDILRAARDAKDVQLKVTYYRSAMSQLQKEKKFDLMVTVLDGLDGDDFKQAAPLGWDNWRVDASYRGALAAFEANDIGTAYRHIDRAPKRLRPYIRSEIVAVSSVARNKEFFLENLDEMQKELGAFEFPVEEAAKLYKDLAHHYLTARPTESEGMFREAVKFINKADSENPDFLVAKDWAPMSNYVAMKSELLEIDELSIVSSLNKITSRRSRVRLKLGLLESSLPRFVEAKKKFDQMNRKPIKEASAKGT
jgi:tetratricopeptide (TPR) repeat protein